MYNPPWPWQCLLHPRNLNQLTWSQLDWYFVHSTSMLQSCSPIHNFISYLLSTCLHLYSPLWTVLYHPWMTCCFPNDISSNCPWYTSVWDIWGHGRLNCHMVCMYTFSLPLLFISGPDAEMHISEDIWHDFIDSSQYGQSYCLPCGSCSPSRQPKCTITPITSRIIMADMYIIRAWPFESSPLVAFEWFVPWGVGRLHPCVRYHKVLFW